MWVVDDFVELELGGIDVDDNNLDDGVLNRVVVCTELCGLINVGTDFTVVVNGVVVCVDDRVVVLGVVVEVVVVVVVVVDVETLRGSVKI